MKNIRMKVAQMNSTLHNLQTQRDEIRFSGRDREWQGRALNEATLKAKNKIKELSGEALSEWLKELAEAKKTEPKKDYQERSFYQQKFNAMLQQVNSEQIPQLFERVANDGEMAKYKDDFCDLADLKIDDENRNSYEKVKQEKMTPEEREQKKQIDKAFRMKSHLQTIEGLALDSLMDDIIQGRDLSMDLTAVFDEALAKADKTAGRGVGEKNEERAENQEMLRQTMAQTQSE